MRKIIPIVLWILMVVCGIVIFWQALRRQPDAPQATEHHSDNPPGAVIVDVPWTHLPDIDTFQLTDQNGDDFDSTNLLGKPYAVSFFFAACPSICRDLNAQVKRLNDQLRKEDIAFVSISVDPENDTPEILNRYAQDYEAIAGRWNFLTGPQYKVKEIGEHNFNVVVDKATHTDNILLIDKWGRYRDRFKWDDPYDMKRFVRVAKDLVDEAEPPLNKTVSTRNALAGQPPIDLNVIPWLGEFHMTELNGESFFSRDLTGKVWLANFFFIDCPGVCQQQNEYLADLQKRLGDSAPKIISITTDPVADTPERLATYAKSFAADPKHWLFLTGQTQLIHRLGPEMFGVESNGVKHSSLLFVMDRWGNVRGKFDWQKSEQEVVMLALIEELKAETVPTGASIR